MKIFKANIKKPVFRAAHEEAFKSEPKCFEAGRESALKSFPILLRFRHTLK